MKFTAVPNQHSQYLVTKIVEVEVSSCLCQRNNHVNCFYATSVFAYYSAAVGHLVMTLALCLLGFADPYVIPASLRAKRLIGRL